MYYVRSGEKIVAFNWISGKNIVTISTDDDNNFPQDHDSN